MLVGIFPDSPRIDRTIETTARMPPTITNQLAQKYDGDFKNESSDGIYTATILLNAFTAV